MVRVGLCCGHCLPLVAGVGDSADPRAMNCTPANLEVIVIDPRHLSPHWPTTAEIDHNGLPVRAGGAEPR